MKPGAIIGIIAVLIAAWYFFLRGGGKTIAGKWGNKDIDIATITITATGIAVSAEGEPLMHYAKHESTPNAYFRAFGDARLNMRYDSASDTLISDFNGGNKQIVTRAK